MSFTNFLGDTFEDEHDQNMTYQLGSSYKYIKNKYPNAYKLPKDELQTMISTVRNKGNTLEEGEQYLNQYIKANEPQWQKTYFGNNNGQTTSMMPNSNVNYRQKPAGSYQIAQNGADMQTPQPMANLDQQRKELVDDFYNHLKDDKIEGYYRRLYCDPIGLETVGAGLRTFTPQNLKNYTITSGEGPVSSSNPDWSDEQKVEFGKRMQEMCKSYCKDWGTNEKSKPECNKWAVPRSVQDQIKQYVQDYNTQPPYFQDADLEAKSKKYITNTVLPHTVEQFNNLGKDFYNYNREGQKAFIDIPYSTGPNGFLLHPYKKGKGYWPNMSQAIMKDDMETAAKESKRGKVSGYRNDWTAGGIRHALDK